MNATAPGSQQANCIQLKGSLLPLTVLELIYFDAIRLASELAEKAAQAPDFFKGLPVVIGLSKYNEESGPIDFQALIQVCNIHSISPIAVRGGSDTLIQAASQAGLAYLPDQKERTQPAIEAPSSAEQPAESQQPIEAQQATKAQQPGETTGTTAAPTAEQPETTQVAAQPQNNRIIYQPVRSGQQVYAKNGDLIVLSQVSAGAEVLADGNIHVYGPLRGRALAGVQGDTKARIFCQSLEAELVSIAGQYKISEDLQHEHWKKPTQIHFSDEKLTIKPLVD